MKKQREFVRICWYRWQLEWTLHFFVWCTWKLKIEREKKLLINFLFLLSCIFASNLKHDGEINLLDKSQTYSWFIICNCRPKIEHSTSENRHSALSYLREAVQQFSLPEWQTLSVSYNSEEMTLSAPHGGRDQYLSTAQQLLWQHVYSPQCVMQWRESKHQLLQLLSHFSLRTNSVIFCCVSVNLFLAFCHSCHYVEYMWCSCMFKKKKKVEECRRALFFNTVFRESSAVLWLVCLLLQMFFERVILKAI